MLRNHTDLEHFTKKTTNRVVLGTTLSSYRFWKIIGAEKHLGCFPENWDGIGRGLINPKATTSDARFSSKGTN